MKISTKLTIQILLISVIPLLILGGVALYQMGQLAEKEFFEKVSRDADFHQQQIEDYLSGQQRKVETLAASSQISALLSRILSSIDEELLPSPTGQSEIDQATKAYLDHYFWREAPSVVQDDSFSDLYLISNEGEVLYSYEHTEVMGQLVPQGEALTILRGIWSKVTEEETLVVEGYRRSPQSGEMAMYIASPVYSWKEMIGVVIVEYDAEWVEEMLVQSALLGDTEDLVVLVDGGDKAEFIRESRFLGLSHPCKAYSNSLLDPVLVSVEGDESRGVGWRINSRCQEVVADWRFLKAINAMMVVTVEKTEVMESYLWFQKLFTSLIAGVMLIILIISFSASHRITRRVVVLTQHALEIATGDLQQRIGDFGNDEVGVLADALRSMMKTIRDRTRTLEHANQRMLEEEIHREELIETRTQELFEANSYMEKILASMHDVLVVSDQHGKIRMMNPAAMELLGYSEEELLGRPLLEVIDANIGESSEQFNLQQLDNLRKNLEEVMVSDHACAQRQLENSLIALLWIDERCMVEVANIEAERVFGYSREVLFGCKIERLIPDLDLASIEESTVIEVQGRTQEGGDVEIHLGVTPIHTPEGLRQLLVIYDQAIAERWALSTFTPFGRLFFQGGQYPEVQLKERDGALIPALLSGEVLRDSQQRYQGFVLVMWDLRERKALEAKSNEAAYQGGLGEMSATILHNIGNVVTGLGGSVHSVRQQLDDLQLVSKGLGRLGEQLQESDVNVERLQQMSRAVGEASIIVDQVASEKMGRQLDSIEKGVQHVADIITLQQGLVHGGIWATEFSLHEAIHESVGLQALSMEKANVVCHQQLDQTIDAVRLPRGQLQQLLVNLLKNSREAIEMNGAIEPGEIWISVSRLPRPGGGEQFKLSVSDNGGGVSDEVMKKIFDSGFTTKSTGNGLGLHSAATFAQSVGGDIQLKQGEYGAQFEVDLPVWFEEE